MGDHSERRDEASTAATETSTGSDLDTRLTGTQSATRDEATASEEVGWNTRSYALESALYHKAREGFLDLCHRWLLAMILIGSNATVLAIVEKPRIVAYLAIIPAVLASFDIAFGFSSKARDHRELAAEFLSVVSMLSGSPRPDQITEASARFYSACGREPATFVALQALAHNQACDALEDPESLGPRHRVSWIHNTLKNVFRFSGKDFALH